MKAMIISSVRSTSSGNKHQRKNILNRCKKIVLLLLATFTLSCCNKDDNPFSGNDQLPPETQTGANTVGCLLDGKAFLPDNLPNSTNCFYQLISGEYYFTIRFSNKNSNNVSITLALKTEQKAIAEGLEYDLFKNEPNNAYGCYFYGAFFNYTSNIYTGKLKITKLDTVNHIVSGTFWFDILDFQGNAHQIREGRFDMQYTN